jgi:hypothetical protein
MHVFVPNDKSTVRSRMCGHAVLKFLYFQFFPFVVHLPIKNYFPSYVPAISVAGISQSI